MSKIKNAPCAFAEIPHSPRTHFRLHFYAAVYQVIFHIQRLSEYGGMDLEEAFAEYPFLGSYFAEMVAFMPDEIEWGQASAWWEREIQTWESSSAVHLPLVALGRQMGIGFKQRIALVLVGLAEEDSRFGTLFEKLQAPLPYRQACQELVGQMLLDSTEAETIDNWKVFQSLESSGLLEISNQDAPRSEWIPRVPMALWNIISGDTDAQPIDWGDLQDADSFPCVQDLIYPESFIRQLTEVPHMLSKGTTHAVVLRGSQGSDGLQIFGAIARELDLGLMAVSENGSATKSYWRKLGPLCVLQRVMPILSYDLTPSETIKVPRLGAYQGPIGIIMGHEGGLFGKTVEQALTLRIPMLPAADRLRRWELAFDGHAVKDLSQINQRYQLPGGYIRKLAALALARAELEKEESVTPRHVLEASRCLNRQMLDKLATQLAVKGTWDQLIVNPTTSAKLRELEKHCLHRERILDHLSPAFAMDANRGVRALFTGKSGTGKTMAAKILAASLGMDLYRVDLAAVINKYVGETEKNLHRVLTRAEELDIVLLLDEGDALLGNRTEVKSANDRFANLETNYLLQKLETYQGIVIVTSNVSENIDRAFQRRMDVVVSFIPPRAAERLRIWELHLPEDHEVDEGYLDEVTSRCELTGGQIRNAALFATLLALDQGRSVQSEHLQQAIQSEYQKAGAANPLENGNSDSHQQKDLIAFANMLD